MAKPRTPPKPLTPQLDAREIPPAVDRLAKAGALHVLVRGALPLALLRRLLKEDVRKEEAATLPDEGWANLAVSVLYESADFEVELAELLQERLGWDRPPASLEDWFLGAADRPLETLWNAAFSSDKALRKEFPRLAAQCLESWRASPACVPPTWSYVEALLTHQAKQDQDLRDLERGLGDAERRLESERLRVEELREELKRLRREGAELRAERAQAWRKAEGEREQARAREGDIDQKRIEELERRARKAEKEREHALAELDRLRARLEAEAGQGPVAAGSNGREPEDDVGDEDVAATNGLPPHASVSQDPNPRRRVLRIILRKLFQKSKIGAAHTHEDNVYRGVPDHEKGLAKEAMDLLYREGWLRPKPTVADPHVSLEPERLPEIRALIGGEVSNPRLLAFIGE